MGDTGRLALELADHDGVITVERALACGLTREQIRYRVRSGSWKSLARGVFRSCSHAYTEAATVRAAVAALRGVLWALAEPVTRTEYAHREALAYAAAITEGLRRAVDGDTGYGGLLTKNPTHDDWDTEWIHSAGYELDQLAEGLGDRMPPPRWRETKRQRWNVAGLRRNCALFESARHWAYREARLFLPAQDADGLGRSIHREVHERNAAFADPLPTSGARAIAASIHRWITTRSRLWADGSAVYEATFTIIQAARGRKSAEARKRTIDKRIATLRAGV